MRTILRFLSLLFLAAAVMFGIVDSIQSVAGESLFVTPFGAALFSFNPDLLSSAEAYAHLRLPAFVWDKAATWVLVQPAFAVCLALALLFWVIAFKRQPAAGRFAA